MDCVLDKTTLFAKLEQVAQQGLKSVLVSTCPPVPSKQISPHIHWKFRLIMVVSGCYRFNYYYNGIQSGEISCGDALITLPGGVLQNVETPPCEVLTVVFWDSFTRFLINIRIGLTNEQHWYHTARPARAFVRSLIQTLDAFPADQELYEARKLLIQGLIKILKTELHTDSPGVKSKSFSTYQAVIAFMSENLQTPITRDIVARHLHLNPSHISRLFQCFSDQSFQDVLKAMRADHAVYLLKNNSSTITEVAYACGFGSAAHFIRTFKRIHGITPGRYRSDLPKPRNLDRDH